MHAGLLLLLLLRLLLCRRLRPPMAPNLAKPQQCDGKCWQNADKTWQINSVDMMQSLLLGDCVKIYGRPLLLRNTDLLSKRISLRPGRALEKVKVCTAAARTMCWQAAAVNVDTWCKNFSMAHSNAIPRSNLHASKQEQHSPLHLS